MDKHTKHALILGGDGYLGWPTALHFSALGYRVTVVDNYSKRQLFKDNSVEALFPIPEMGERAWSWHEKTGKEIKVVVGDLADPAVMNSLFLDSLQYTWCIDSAWSGQPDTIVHFAEQPSAPYSMLDHASANYTLSNNLLVTNNLIWSVKEHSPASHIIKLGTMGEYGTPNIDIEEGWLNVEHKGRSDKFLFPRQASSLYHTTKIMDTDLLWFAVRLWGLSVTDLMQGPVYGIHIDEFDIDPSQKTFFSYDEMFGTVLNRFVTQAVIGHPLTVYGEGGQTRGYINLSDTLQCIRLSAENPSGSGELRIFNQISETFTVNEIAQKIKEYGEKNDIAVKVDKIENPRKELEIHYYNPTYQGLKDIGVTPKLLTNDVLAKIFAAVEEHKANIDTGVIFRGVKF